MCEQQETETKSKWPRTRRRVRRNNPDVFPRIKEDLSKKKSLTGKGSMDDRTEKHGPTPCDPRPRERPGRHSEGAAPTSPGGPARAAPGSREAAGRDSPKECSGCLTPGPKGM